MATTCAGKDPGVQVEPKIYDDDEWDSSKHQDSLAPKKKTSAEVQDADSRILRKDERKKNA